jgi:hypothetical protein
MIEFNNGDVIYCKDIPDMLKVALGLLKAGYSVHLHPKRLTIEIMEV